MLISAFLRFFAAIIISIRLIIWNLFYKESKVVNLKILKGQSSKFYTYGDITRILYSEQLLVNYKKSFEYDTLEMYANLLKPDSIVIDIGANIGLFSILGAKYVTGNGIIYAIEPTKKTFEVLEKNLQINDIKNVKPFRKAFSNVKSIVSMVSPESALKDNYGDSFNQIRVVSGSELQVDTIETSLLDDFIKEQNITKIDLIKIDVEGAELLCFQGGINLLNSKNKPVIILECFEAHCKSFGHKVMDVLTLLDKSGYDLNQFNYFQWIATPKDF